MHWKQDILSETNYAGYNGKDSKGLLTSGKSTLVLIHNPCTTSHLKPRHELPQGIFQPTSGSRPFSPTHRHDSVYDKGFGSEWKDLFNTVSFPCKIDTSDIDFDLQKERAIALT
jgi:hypothetical protein